MAALRRAFNAPLRAYALRGLSFVLGAAAAMFMGVVCLRRGPGAQQTLCLLDWFMTLCLIAAQLSQLWLRRLCGGDLTAIRAAVERREDGSAGVVYVWDGRAYSLRVARVRALPRSGMVDILINAAHPRAVIPGKEPQAKLPGAWCAGVLAALTVALNAIYFLR